jgi:hypothetical protein
MCRMCLQRTPAWVLPRKELMPRHAVPAAQHGSKLTLWLQRMAVFWRNELLVGSALVGNKRKWLKMVRCLLRSTSCTCPLSQAEGGHCTWHRGPPHLARTAGRGKPLHQGMFVLCMLVPPALAVCVSQNGSPCSQAAAIFSGLVLCSPFPPHTRHYRSSSPTLAAKLSQQV